MSLYGRQEEALDAHMNLSFQSEIFPTEQIELAGTTETVVRGSRELFALLPQALRGVEEIGVLGW